MKISFSRLKYFLLGSILLLGSCSPKLITRTFEKKSSDLRFLDGTKAILFVENRDLMQNRKELEHHNQTTKSLFQQFGMVTISLPMFSTSGKVFQFGTGDFFWVVDMNHAKKRTAMIIFDGKQKPVIEYNPDKYAELINKYFSKDIAKKNEDLEQEIAKKALEEPKIKQRLDSLLQIEFTPSKEYAQAIINNRGSLYYNYGIDTKCDGILLIEIFQNQKKDSPNIRTKSHYRKGLLSKYTFTNLENKYTSETKYYHSPTTELLDSIVTFGNGRRMSSTYFKYLSDRYLYWTDDYGQTTEVLLDKQLKTTKRVTYQKNGEILTETFCEYNSYGQLIGETDFSNGSVWQKRIYAYDHPSDKNYAKLTISNSNNSVTEYSTTFKDGQKIQHTKTDGKFIRKSISNYDNCGEGSQTDYDSDDNIITHLKAKKIDY